MVLGGEFYWVAGFVVLMVGASKGGFGGGLGMLAVPLLALLVDPRIAAAILLPILCVMDGVSLLKFRGKWNSVSLQHLLPGALVGTALGALTFTLTNADLIRILVGSLSLYFVVHLIWGKRYFEKIDQDRVKGEKPSLSKGLFWGTVSGFSSYIAHAGGPPVAIYLLPQRLSKSVFASTTIMFFSIINFVKLIPYVWLQQINEKTIIPSLMLLPLAPLGVLLGLYLHHRVSEKVFYVVTCSFLSVAGLKLTYQGMTGYFS